MKQFHVKWRARSKDSWESMCRTFDARKPASKWIKDSIRELKLEGNPGPIGTFKIFDGPASCSVGGMSINWFQLALIGGAAYVAVKAAERFLPTKTFV